jgi:hypothetical protein
MKIWITCFILLFGMAEFFQWLKDLMLSLPVYIVAGVLLAIASNTEHLPSLPLQLLQTKLGKTKTTSL